MFPFIESKYSKFYFALMARAKDRKLLCYAEDHHILPKSLGGTNDLVNIARLTAREHFIAHRLLAKIANGFDAKRKMNFALYALMHMGKHCVQNSRLYEQVRQMHASDLSMLFKGKSFSAETRAKMSTSAKSRPPISESTRALMSSQRKGKTTTLGFKHSAETLVKMRRAGEANGMHGRKHSAESIERMRLTKRLNAKPKPIPVEVPRKERVVSKETRAKISAASRTLIHSEETKARIARSSKEAWLKRRG